MDVRTGEQDHVRKERNRSCIQAQNSSFDGRVAIAPVYDEYSKHHPHAGSLADFKCRLVDEARRHKLSLQRADKPELLETELRQRSEAQWDGEQYTLSLSDESEARKSLPLRRGSAIPHAVDREAGDIKLHAVIEFNAANLREVSKHRSETDAGVPLPQRPPAPVACRH